VTFGLWEVAHFIVGKPNRKCGTRVGEDGSPTVPRGDKSSVRGRDDLRQRLIQLATNECDGSASSTLKRRSESGAPRKSLAEASAGEQRRFSLSLYRANGWRRVE
jgi:hypothetical protein